MNSILIIDDREEFINKFVNIAGNKAIGVSYAKSFEGLKEKMPKLHHKIAVVILDIKCLISDDQEVEDEAFIGTAITYLDQYYPNFPRIILTGDDDAFEGYSTYHQNEEIFLKTDNDIERLFERVQFFCNNSENLKIKREFSDIFEIFEQNLIELTHEVKLLNIIKDINSTQTTKYGRILRDVRAMQEVIYKSINLVKKDVVPDNMFLSSNGMIKFNNLMKHLNGYPDNEHIATKDVYQNQAIYNLSYSLYWCCGEYIHDGVTKDYMISKNGLNSLIYNLLELLVWAKKYL